MIKNKKITKVAVLTLTGLLLTSGLIPSASAATNTLGTEKVHTEQPVLTSEENQNQMINAVKNYVSLNTDGTISLSDSIPNEIAVKYQTDVLKERFDILNQSVQNGEIVINNDLSITEKSSANYAPANYAMAASSKIEKRVEYWWGHKNWYNNRQAINAQNALNTAAGAATLAAGLSSLGFPPGAFAGGIAAGYWTLLSARIGANNQGKGVTVSMTWAMVFTVAKR